jgi:hypothetical protein
MGGAVTQVARVLERLPTSDARGACMKLAIALAMALAAAAANAQGQSRAPAVTSANGKQPFLFDGRMRGDGVRQGDAEYT